MRNTTSPWSALFVSEMLETAIVIGAFIILSITLRKYTCAKHGILQPWFSNTDSAMAERNLPQRVTDLEGQLANVAKLSAATAKGWGKDRASRQIVLFATGSFRTKLCTLWDSWKAGAAEARWG